VVNPGPLDREGVSVFYKDQTGAVYHTYSSYARGIDMLNGAYHCLDLVPKGRDEDHLEFTQAWVAITIDTMSEQALQRRRGWRCIGRGRGWSDPSVLGLRNAWHCPQT
jgi:hypothetical protein